MVMFFKAKMYITKSLEDRIPHQLRALNIEREMCNNRGKGLGDRLPGDCFERSKHETLSSEKN